MYIICRCALLDFGASNVSTYVLVVIPSGAVTVIFARQSMILMSICCPFSLSLAAISGKNSVPDGKLMV